MAAWRRALADDALPDAKSRNRWSAKARLPTSSTLSCRRVLPVCWTMRAAPLCNAFWMRIRARLPDYLSTKAGSNDADLTEHEDFISDMAEQFNACGYLLRLDRQIYAA